METFEMLTKTRNRKYHSLFSKRS